MCVGAPIIANDVPEHREVLGDTALFYSPGSETEFAHAVDRVLAEPKLADRLRASARARADERYRWHGVVSRYEQLFYAMKAEAAQ
jgi:glycosyltransferase involved in cell wall biosynthesis